MKMMTVMVMTIMIKNDDFIDYASVITTQSAFTCSKLTIETLEQGMKYVRS